MGSISSISRLDASRSQSSSNSIVAGKIILATALFGSAACLYRAATKKRSSGRRNGFCGPCQGARLCIGGHKDGVWVHGKICYKKFQSRGRGEREVKFLRALHRDKAWSSFVPPLHRIVSINGNKWLVMENILSDFRDGVIMDIKMGRRTWSASASEAKKIRKAEKDRQYTSFELGVRIVAAEIKHLGDVDVQPRLIGDKVGSPVKNQEQVKEGIEKFLSTIDLRNQALSFLENILNVFEKHAGYIFYSSSLLFAYDAAVPSGRRPKLRVKMIDFAHVEVAKKGRLDDGYIAGLKTLIHILTGENVKPLRSETSPSSKGNSRPIESFRV